MILIAKVLLTIAAIQYGVIPILVDFSDTHVFHADWPPHARFHLVWLLAIGGILAGYVIANVWIFSSNRLAVLRPISLLGCIVLSAFFLAAIFRSQYGGSITDAIEPHDILGVNANIFSFAIASVFQITAVAILWRDVDDA